MAEKKIPKENTYVTWVKPELNIKYLKWLCSVTLSPLCTFTTCSTLQLPFSQQQSTWHMTQTPDSRHVCFKFKSKIRGLLLSAKGLKSSSCGKAGTLKTTSSAKRKHSITAENTAPDKIRNSICALPIRTKKEKKKNSSSHLQSLWCTGSACPPMQPLLEPPSHKKVEGCLDSLGPG